MADASELAFHNPGTMAPPLGPYSHVARVPGGSDLLVFAGQIGNAPDGSVPDAPEAQYENALRNVGRMLESEGAGPQHLVKINTYVVGEIDLGEVVTILRSFLGDARPASTFLYVPRLARPSNLVEVEAWAVRPTS
jgi:ribosomal-protein-alanine N-acetyltransferase